MMRTSATINKKGEVNDEKEKDGTLERPGNSTLYAE